MSGSQFIAELYCRNANQADYDLRIRRLSPSRRAMSAVSVGGQFLRDLRDLRAPLVGEGFGVRGKIRDHPFTPSTPIPATLIPHAH